MTANERFEKAWGSFLVYLNRNPKAQLTPFLKERHICLLYTSPSPRD